MRFLVTGGAGFIGSHIVENLLQQKHKVRVLDDFSTGKSENLAFAKGSQNIEVIEGDIRQPALVAQSMQGVDGVFHEAALVSVPKSVEQPDLSFDINVKGTFNVFEGARKAGVKRVVYASSAAVYGDNDRLPLAETETPKPLSPYGLDKLYNEQLGALYQTLYGLEMFALRYFNVFGPRQDPKSPYSGVISIFVDRLKTGANSTIFGDGEQTRDFVYVGDVVHANLLAMFGEYRGFRVLNVGSGRKTSLNELFAHLKEITQSAATPRYAEARAGDIRHSLANISAIQKELIYTPDFSLAEGLRALLAKL